MKEKLVSICVPIYGVERFIERCVVTLFSQTYDNLEFIFVDDCTKDNSIEVLKAVLKHYPEREEQVRIIRHDHNRGLAAARNTGVAASTGEFLLHVDADDYIETNTVEKLICKQEEADYDIVSCEYLAHYRTRTSQIVITDYSTVKEMIISMISRENSSQIWGRLIRSSLYKDNGITVQEGNNMAEDAQTTPRIFYFAKNIASVHEPLFHYCDGNENSYTASFSVKSEMFKRKAFDVLADFFANKDPDYIEAINQGMVNSIAASLFGMARRRESKEYYLESLELLRKYDKRYIDALSSKLRTTCWLAPYRPALAVYARVGHRLNMLLMKLKKQ